MDESTVKHRAGRKPIEPATPFGARLRQHRQSRGLTQKQFADAIGVQQGLVAGMETGKKQPSFQTLTKIVNFLNVGYDDLVNPHESAAAAVAA